MIWDGTYETRDSLRSRYNSNRRFIATELSSLPSYSTRSLPANPVTGQVALITGDECIYVDGVWRTASSIRNQPSLHRAIRLGATFYGKTPEAWNEFFKNNDIDVDTAYHRVYIEMRKKYGFVFPNRIRPKQTRKFKAELEEIRKRKIVKRINDKFHNNALTIKELRQSYNLPAIIPPETPIKDRLDFWNYPDWDKAGNQPFWMFDNAEPKPEPVPEPPKPTHKRVIKNISGVEIVIMEPL